MTERAANLHRARVYLVQSRHFARRDRPFAFVLLEWVANARRLAAADGGKPQKELFA